MPLDYEMLARRANECRGVSGYGLEDVVWLIDGFVMRIQTPPSDTDNRLGYFSQHYRCWCVNMLTFVDTLGRAVTILGPMAATEAALAAGFDFAEFLRQIHAHGGGWTKFLTDSGFALNKAGTLAELLIGFTFTIGPKSINRCKAIAYDPELRAHFGDSWITLALDCLHATMARGKLRAVNENYNSALRTFAVLRVPYRSQIFAKPLGKTTVMPKTVIRCVAMLVNYRMLHGGKPLRPLDFHTGDVMHNGVPLPRNEPLDYGIIDGVEARNGAQFSQRLLRAFKDKAPHGYKISKAPIDFEPEDDGDEEAGEDGGPERQIIGDFLVESVGRRRTTRRQRGEQPEFDAKALGKTKKKK